ncbi:putative Cell division protein [Thiomonas arsenitoxydans]|uniref:Cell division protein n=1 Tax=Thiomonas arsenitoxydans (strain DSM 22701 / CIP 110005 / 3As) TaxID=426114 RepID=D6CVI9_THIA3|nr:SPOR domain-containing protein [Thiomonas arsenitoxydans]CAZ89308.1 putative Cell division protein [Thiomonas arsenitoxydans]CQR34057.1 putative Cell division protein [Thiomonas arsenitoxydans]CQR35386.1 putative Cell division protein [Thiomonas arsenitoxydans]CQR37620.1 putative Cell division protein [Thiomonas arsenitoxydans]CQR37766.1 putative Cell division protein [Thiomonas arsenitoxydans]
MTFGAPRNSARRSSRGDDSGSQSQDSLRARARRRLIGAVALVLLGVIVFPLVFDSKPKPVPSNIALDIPSQSKAPGLAVPASAPMLPAASSVAVPSGERAAVAHAASAVAAATAPVPPEPVVASKPAPQPIPAAPKPSPVQQAEPVVPPPAPKPPAPTPEQARQLASARQALAALEGKSPDQISTAQAEAALANKQHATQEDAAPSKARFVVQAGAFADAHAAQSVRAKIEKAGFKTYTQVVDTAQGKRVRVRIGPFATRDEAERALHKLQALGLSGAVLTL